MSTTIKIEFKPKEADLIYIQSWLREEDTESGTGFYCNINIINKSFHEKEMAIISVDKKAIGFVIWSFTTDYSARIDISEIHPKFRGFGYGRVLINHLFQYFVSKNIYAVDLECAPASSIHFWKKLKFQEFPKNDKSQRENVELYRILLDVSKPIKSKVSSGEVIELWGGEPYETRDSDPDWTWQVEHTKGTKKLKKPIIFPCYFDWRIRWRKGNDVFHDEKVKRLKKVKIPYGSYLIIDNLN